ncbi:hypothetical protein EN943_07490 [Mesorhizobium sp. M7A.F.Ca.US.006.01.1.1]|uniref:hypothetical protein n=1 Tax=Mesorhizobium sp. M7A.F.Ca.US.006.01.1.1 TaxID=2496707 RepID=UPI000FCCD232|nr:hypothetical protein [Mesorhizobium sp. M7A.F.Ca.US.006.01.1.1]RUZ79408.1 hypothetical protein EN943_07490 [Mesorhizobium sp. M7A.F.Ca.US.006.01.1.1]
MQYSFAMLPTLTPIALGSVLVLTLASQSAFSANVLDRAVEAAQPCRSLKLKTGIGTVGVDKFAGANIEKVQIMVGDDIASAKAVVTMACRTADNAVFKGDASATVDLDAEMNLSTCEMNHLEVQIVKTGGTFASVLDAFKDEISEALKRKITSELGKLCK